MPDLDARVTIVESAIDTLEKRIDSLRSLTEDVHSLAVSLATLNERQKTTSQKVDDLASDVKEIKEKPAKHWEAIIASIISAGVGAVITLLLK